MGSNPPLRPPVAGQVTWTVDSQTRTVGKGPDGKLTSGYEIAFTTRGGVQGVVFVPASLYTVANVQAAIGAHALELDQVQAMGKQ